MSDSQISANAQLREAIINALARSANAAAIARDAEIIRKLQYSNDLEKHPEETFRVLEARALKLIEHGFSKEELEPLLKRSKSPAISDEAALPEIPKDAEDDYSGSAM
jgi:hypothetical protein